ncbi:Cysteine proteinase inhibitor 12 [Zostera marina]|uniref:Cysteine proteinase inhibitor n=1 Tax=Zostera marina TaxID=29655 RepID=A0A0K9NIM8_ZOSMR|nr:Cysteine proteinase inhibitor 12 [Zostera marina]
MAVNPCFVLFASLILGVGNFVLGSKMAKLGGVFDSVGFENSAELADLAIFAVQEHNNKENTLLEFSRIVKAKEQVVAGKLHHLTVEVVEAGEKILYEATVWVKPWLNFKELTHFNRVDQPSAVFTASDLGAVRGEHLPGWHVVSPHDPVVKDAANHAVQAIQERSNSLFPYELVEILQSKAEVIGEAAKFDMLLKVSRGDKLEKFKVEVHKNLAGNFLLNQMQMEHNSD